MHYSSLLFANMHYSSSNDCKICIHLQKNNEKHMGKSINYKLAINIGDCLRKIRMSQGDNITQRDVAEGAGISTRYYAYLELGQKIPSFEVIMKIARAYKMPLSEFVKHFENQL